MCACVRQDNIGRIDVDVEKDAAFVQVQQQQQPSWEKKKKKTRFVGLIEECDTKPNQIIFSFLQRKFNLF